MTGDNAYAVELELIIVATVAGDPQVLVLGFVIVTDIVRLQIRIWMARIIISGYVYCR